MKVIALNGSPRKNGNTKTALIASCKELERAGIETEILEIGSLKISGCMGCNACAKTGACVFNDAALTELMDKIAAADGLIVGAPVYYGGINGTLKSFLDRFFYTNGGKMTYKPAAALSVARRTGGLDAYTQILRYFQLSEMLVTPSRYFGALHGRTEGEVTEDGEGMMIARDAGATMAWLLKSLEGIAPPVLEERTRTHFVR